MPLARNSGLGMPEAGPRPRVSKAWANKTRLDLELPDAGVEPRVGKAWTARDRQGRKLPDACPRPGVGRAWAAGARPGLEFPDACVEPRAGKAWAARTRLGLGFPDAGPRPGVGRARAARTRLGLELPDAGLCPGVGKARAARKKPRREWRSRRRTWFAPALWPLCHRRCPLVSSLSLLVAAISYFCFFPCAPLSVGVWGAFRPFPNPMVTAVCSACGWLAEARALGQDFGHEAARSRPLARRRQSLHRQGAGGGGISGRRLFATRRKGYFGKDTAAMMRQGPEWPTKVFRRARAKIGPPRCV